MLPFRINMIFSGSINRISTKKLPWKCTRSMSYKNSIDCHTHMYTPKYMNILRKRANIPRVLEINGEHRLLVLPGEDKEITTTSGRPIGREYFDVEYKLRFMEVNGIERSVISLANPWLDFLAGDEAAATAQELNDELQSLCEQSKGKLYGFATLPMRNPKAAVAEVERLKSQHHIKGVIMGTTGAGKGLDDVALDDLLYAIEEANYLIFVHPHYGVGNEFFQGTGHSLFLALGFPMETTIAISRLIVSGALDKHPKLKLFIAHAGAALPALIGRLDSCVEHDLAVSNRLRHAPSEYFKRMYFDAVSYNTDALKCLISQVGSDRLVFGTDNPFFPPLHEKDITNVVWPSTAKVYQCIDELDENIRNKILFTNATKILDL